MDYLDRPFEVTRGSGRRPTPLTYQHLRKYSALELAYLKLSSQFDITNINSILEQTANLYVSNEIHRVIAQVIGQLDPGFITIKGTSDGALHVSIEAGLNPLLTGIILAAGTNLIGKVEIDGPSQAQLSLPINISATGVNDVIPVATGKSHHISSIFFTVAGVVNVTLRDQTGLKTGSMDFGGTNEPRGMTHNFGQFPLICQAGEKFQIDLQPGVQVSGIVTYYDE